MFQVRNLASTLRKTASYIFYWGLDESGLNALNQRRFRDRLLVLCYHGVVQESHAQDSFGYHNTVSAAEFSAHLNWLAMKYTPVSLSDVRDWARGRGDLPRRPVLITFDDGYRNNVTVAAPVLVRHSIPAAFHVSTGYIGSDRVLWPDEVVSRVLNWPHSSIAWPGSEKTLPVPSSRRDFARSIAARCKAVTNDERLQFMRYLRDNGASLTVEDKELMEFMNWDDVRSLSKRGFDIGSHTVEHPILSRLDDASVETELVESKRMIEKEIGRECFSLAYPNGLPRDYSAVVVDYAKAAGYSVAFTIGNGRSLPRVDPFQIGRDSVAGHLPQQVFRAVASGTRALA